MLTRSLLKQENHELRLIRLGSNFMREINPSFQVSNRETNPAFFSDTKK